MSRIAHSEPADCTKAFTMRNASAMRKIRDGCCPPAPCRSNASPGNLKEILDHLEMSAGRGASPNEFLRRDRKTRRKSKQEEETGKMR